MPAKVTAISSELPLSQLVLEGLDPSVSAPLWLHPAFKPSHAFLFPCTTRLQYPITP